MIHNQCAWRMAMTHCISVVIYWNPRPLSLRLVRFRLEIIQLHPQSKQSPLRLKWWELWNIVSIRFYWIFKTMIHNRYASCAANGYDALYLCSNLLKPTFPQPPLVRLDIIQLHPQSKQPPLRLKWWELWNIVSIRFYLIFKTMTHNWCALQMAMTHCIFLVIYWTPRPLSLPLVRLEMIQATAAPPVPAITPQVVRTLKYFVYQILLNL